MKRIYPIIEPTTEAEAAKLKAEVTDRFLQERLSHREDAGHVMQAVRGNLPKEEVAKRISEMGRRKFIGLAMATALEFIPATATSAGLHLHGIGGGGAPPPPTPQWPAAVGGYTNYWVADPTAGGSDSNNGLSQTNMGGGVGPWATVTKVNSGPGGGYGSGNVAIGFLSTFTYTCPLNGSLTPPTSPANCIVQGLVGATLPPVIQANGGGFIGIIIQNGSNCVVSGLNTAGDGGGNTVSAVQNGSFNTIEYSYLGLSTLALDSGGYCVLMQGHDNLLQNNTIGGVAKTSTESNGVFVQFGSYNQRVLNNEIRYLGAATSGSYCSGTSADPTQDGFGGHVSGTYPLGNSADHTPFTFSGGVPTNVVCEIGFNIIHDCGWNLTCYSPGGPSGMEMGGGNRMWCHDNIAFNVTPNPVIFSVGTDGDPIDAANSGGYWSITERNLCYNSYGGLIDFAGGSSTFTGYISGTTLTVVSVFGGTIGAGEWVNATPTGCTQNTFIEPYGTGGTTGTGGVGTYAVSISQTVGSIGSPQTMGSSLWGATIVRYNLVINCGYAPLVDSNSSGFCCAGVQGENSAGIHQWYGNTFVVMQDSPNAVRTVKNLLVEGISLSGGFFANNIIYAVYPFGVWLSDSIPAGWVNNKNCWIPGGGFDFGGGATYGSYASAAAAQSTFDQNGVASDPLFANGILGITWSAGVATVQTAIPHGQVGTFTGTVGGTSWYGSSTFTGQVDNGSGGAGFILTVSGFAGAPLLIGSNLSASGLFFARRITGFLTGTGGNGTYTINQSAMIGPEGMSATSAYSGTNGTYTCSVINSTHFSFPSARDPTTGAFLASPGIWSLGSTSGLLNANSYKITSASPCYRTGINVTAVYGVDAGSTDFYGNSINPATASIGCHQP